MALALNLLSGLRCLHIVAQSFLQLLLEKLNLWLMRPGLRQALDTMYCNVEAKGGRHSLIFTLAVSKQLFSSLKIKITKGRGCFSRMPHFDTLHIFMWIGQLTCFRIARRRKIISSEP